MHKDKYNSERIVKTIERQTDRQTGVLHTGTDRLLNRKENLYGQTGQPIQTWPRKMAEETG